MSDETTAVVEPTHADAKHEHPNYVLIFVVLAVITLVEIIVPVLIDMPREPLILLLAGLMVAKAVLVALFYMHLITERALYAIVFSVPIVFAVIFTLFLRL